MGVKNRFCLAPVKSFCMEHKNHIHYCMIYDEVGHSAMKWMETMHCGFSLPLATEIIAQLLCGLAEMEERRLINTDVKPDNILISYPQLDLNQSNSEKLKKSNVDILENKIKKSNKMSYGEHKPNSNNSHIDYLEKDRSLSIKIIDFGGTFEHPKDEMIGPAELFSPYIPPEILMKQPFTSSFHIWSVGCVFYELLEYQKLFDDVTNEVMYAQLMLHQMNGIWKSATPLYEQLSEIAGGIQPRTPSNYKEDEEHIKQTLYGRLRRYGKEVTTFISHLLELDPTTRPSAAEALLNPIFNTVRNINVRNYINSLHKTKA